MYITTVFTKGCYVSYSYSDKTKDIVTKITRNGTIIGKMYNTYNTKKYNTLDYCENLKDNEFAIEEASTVIELNKLPFV